MDAHKAYWEITVDTPKGSSFVLHQLLYLWGNEKPEDVHYIPSLRPSRLT